MLADEETPTSNSENLGGTYGKNLVCDEEENYNDISSKFELKGNCLYSHFCSAA